MQSGVIEVESELISAAEEKRRLEEQIVEFRQRIRSGETWLYMNAPAIPDYQQTLEEVLALEAYVEDLQAQVVCLDEVLLELTWEREQ